MSRAEQNDLAYLFRLRMTANVKRDLVRAMRHSDWAEAGQGWQGKETSLRLHGWSRLILARKLLRRASFTSKQDLKQRIETFIAYFSQTLAKAFRWTKTGKPLAA